MAAAGVLFALGSVYLVKTYTGLGMRELFLMAGILTAIGAVLFFATQYKKVALAIFLLGLGFAITLIILTAIAIQTM